MTAGSGIKT